MKVAFFTSHDPADGIAAYTLVVDWQALAMLAGDGVAFLAVWIPLNVAIGCALMLSGAWYRHARYAERRYPDGYVARRWPSAYRPTLGSWMLIVCLLATPLAVAFALELLVPRLWRALTRQEIR